MHISAKFVRMREEASRIYWAACVSLASFALHRPLRYSMLTAMIGAVSLILFLAPDLLAQALDQQVGQALNPLARLLVGPIAKGLAILGLFSFVGFLYAGKWLIAVASLVAAIVLGLMANIINAIFQGSASAGFSLTN